jgi:hypothetical protein
MSGKEYCLRIIHCLNDKESVKIIERMQKSLINMRHEHLVEYLVVAVEEERPTIRFLVVEDSLAHCSISLKNLTERIGNNKLLMQYFSEKTYLFKVMI